MLIKILSASALALGLAVSGAMAQSVIDDGAVYDGSTTVVVPDQTMPPNDTVVVDPGTTQSIYPETTMQPMGQDTLTPLGPCASDTAGPDANSTGMVNDRYCGK
jgi:hypothetical protein